MDKLYTRENLKQQFSNGSRPDENNFAGLINSMINKVDDGISKSANDGLILSPEGKGNTRVISIYDNILDDFANWVIDLGDPDNKGLTISEPLLDNTSKQRLFIKPGHGLGIDTVQPKATLEVNGTIGSKSRIGTFSNGVVPANGKWQDITHELDNCVAFEVVAQVGKEKAGKYAMLIAKATSTFNKSKIHKTQAYYGFCWNKISLRFHGSTHKFKLQIKTRSNYGSDELIRFHVTSLWNKDISAIIAPNNEI